MPVRISGEADRRVTQKLHDGPQILALVQEERRERVTQVVQS